MSGLWGCPLAPWPARGRCVHWMYHFGNVAHHRCPLSALKVEINITLLQSKKYLCMRLKLRCEMNTNSTCADLRRLSDLEWETLKCKGPLTCPLLSLEKAHRSPHSCNKTTRKHIGGKICCFLDCKQTNWKKKLTEVKIVQALTKDFICLLVIVHNVKPRL